MPVSTAAQWARIEALFDAVSELPDAQQASWLAEHCADPALRAQVQAMLAAAADSADFLVRPPEPEQAAPLLAAGVVVGEWRIETLLGRGGSGEVYAVQRIGRDYTQRAALKLLTRLHAPEDRQRFAAERRMLARLQHPGIAGLLDGGEHDGLSYVVMEYVQGRPLTEVARELPLRARIALLLDVCAAVSHAHAHLIVHRDLKPGNILVDDRGRVRLLDFGIARALDEHAADELTTAIRASTGYCAPEQLRGEPAIAATDVYALGVILYEMLTGGRLWPTQGSSLMHALQRLQADEPLPPSTRLAGRAAQALRGDLDAIALRALHHDSAQRYADVDALAGDLRAWLDSRPVQARGSGAAYRIGRTLRRHRWAFASAAAIFLSLLSGVLGFASQARVAAQERDLARQEAARAEAVRQSLTLMFRSAGELPGGDGVTARTVLDRAAARIGDEYATDPRRHADVVIALAELYYFLNDDAGARPLLERLLRDADALEPAQAASARLTLAQVLMRMGEAQPARELLVQAQGYWNGDPQRHRAALLESRLLQSQLEREAGDIERALQTLEAALPQRLAESGERHRDTGVLINNIGIVLYHLGRSAEAVQRFKAADRIWRELGLQDSTDALNTLNNWAAAELQQQHLEPAVSLFERALSLRRALYGPSTATAVLISNYAKTLLQANRPAQAVPLLREAADMAAQYAGERSLPTLAARLGLADALSLTGALDEADVLLDELHMVIDASLGPGHLLGGMQRLSRARWHHERGDIDAAQVAADEARQVFVAMGAAGVAPQRGLDRLEAEWARPAP